MTGPEPPAVSLTEPLFAGDADAAAFAAARPAGAVGRRLEYHRETTSTNTLAAAAARAGEPHGAVVISDEQTAGRGRHGRKWVAPAGRALLLSVIVRGPGLAGERLGWVALAAGLASAEAVERAAGLPARVKWPNDIVAVAPPGGAAGVLARRPTNEDARGSAPIADCATGQSAIGNLKSEIPRFEGPPWRKLGGILVESAVAHRPGPSDYAIAGIGLNVLQIADELPVLPKAPATSVRLETGRAVPRRELLTALLAALDARLAWVRDGDGFSGLQEEVNRRLEAWWGGWYWRLATRHGERAGRFAGLDAHGGLRLRLSDGKVHAFRDAEVMAGNPDG